MKCCIQQRPCDIFQPYSTCDCPWLLKWVLGYQEFSADKQRENVDREIKEYLQGKSYRCS